MDRTRSIARLESLSDALFRVPCTSAPLLELGPGTSDWAGRLISEADVDAKMVLVVQTGLTKLDAGPI